MLYRKTLPIAGTLVVLILAVVVLTGYGRAQNAAAGCQFEPRPLAGLPLDDVVKAALDYTCAKFEVHGSAPQPRLARAITPAEFISRFARGRTDTTCQGQQLALVILRGEFASKADGSPGYGGYVGPNPHFEYLGYVFDLRVGAPMLVRGSLHGEDFRDILNDPTIPTSVPAPTPKNGNTVIPAPTLPLPNQLRPCDYDSVAPTVMPPK